MSMAVVGMIAGMALGFAGYFGGFGAFLLVAALGAIGFVVGRFLEGDLELGDFFRTRDDRRTGGGDVRERRGRANSADPDRRPAGRARRDPDRRPGRREGRRAGGARGARRAAHGGRAAVRAPSSSTISAARIRIHLELDYPCDIGARCGRVRRMSSSG